VNNLPDALERRLVLPLGTQIVTRKPIKDAAGQTVQARGSVGVIAEVLVGKYPHYRIRFPNAGEAELSRQDFAVRKDLRQSALQETAHNAFGELLPYIVYRCVVGSRAYGLDDAESDTDRRGIYLAPAHVQWSLNGAPEQLESESTQETYWELQKFLTMALKANPNVLECLYSPLIEASTPLIDELLAMKHIFLSRFVYQTYNGYVLSQFKKLETDLRTKGEPRWKHAMHLIRLLLSGITVLNEGMMMVQVVEYKDRLLSIKYGEMSWSEVNAWRLSLHIAFDHAFANTSLPEHPDFEQANAFLIRARRSMINA